MKVKILEIKNSISKRKIGEIIEAKRLYELTNEELEESIRLYSRWWIIMGKEWYIYSRRRELLCIYDWKWSRDCGRIILIFTYSYYYIIR